MTWTRITDPEQAVGALPIWFGIRMIGLRGRFGLVLTSGDILRITSITALHELPRGVILLDVLLDHAGVPDGVDQAWQTKHYLGAPVPGATMATVNIAHVVAAVEFVAAEIVEQPDEKALLRRDELEPATAPRDFFIRRPAAADDTDCRLTSRYWPRYGKSLTRRQPQARRIIVTADGFDLTARPARPSATAICRDRWPARWPAMTGPPLRQALQ